MFMSRFLTKKGYSTQNLVPTTCMGSATGETEGTRPPTKRLGDNMSYAPPPNHDGWTASVIFSFKVRFLIQCRYAYFLLISPLLKIMVKTLE